MNRLATLRNYSDESGVDLKSSLDIVAAHLATRPLSGTVMFVVTGDNKHRLLTANLNKPSVDEVPEGTTVINAPNFLVYVEQDALREILRGALSPITALRKGRLRYAGDEKLGLAIFRELASTPDAIFSPCRREGTTNAKP